MGLEYWDVARRKYILYRDMAQHSADCERFPLEAMPRRVFLDTNVINLLVKWRGEIFDHDAIPAAVDQTAAMDIEALRHVFYVGARASWEILASPKTVQELSKTGPGELRDDLLEYALSLVDGSNGDNVRFAAAFGRRLRDSSLAAPLPDPGDRELIGHAIALGCDAFCTCDRATIVRKRDRMYPLPPLRILTPAEWWSHIKPWAGLWGQSSIRCMHGDVGDPAKSQRILHLVISLKV